MEWVSAGQLLRAKANLREAEASRVSQWKDDVDAINPLEKEILKRRFRVSDLAHPIRRTIADKRLIDCELLGPANLIFMGDGSINGTGLMECDVAVLRPSEMIQIFNVVRVENTQFIGGHIWNCTIFIKPSEIEVFRQLGAEFITPTGNPEVDKEQLERSAARQAALEKSGMGWPG